MRRIVWKDESVQGGLLLSVQVIPEYHLSCTGLLQTLGITRVAERPKVPLEFDPRD